MMKKLLTLMLVLVLASAANAVIVGSYTLYTSTTGVAGTYTAGIDNMTISPSDNLWIGVNNSIAGDVQNNQKGSFMLGIRVPTIGSHWDEDLQQMVDDYGPADTSWTGNWQVYVPPLVAGIGTTNEHYGVGDSGMGFGWDMWFLTLTDGNPATFQGAGVLDAKQLHCDGPESYDTLYLVNADDGIVLDTLIIHQMSNVPEPMTLMLLGLGGLLLRRRK
jgi:hypothetical protein